MSKKIYIVLSHTGSAFSRIIKVCTKGEYTHVSIALDKDLNDIYSFGRLRPNNPFIAGFVKEDIEKGTFAKFKNTTTSIYSLDITNDQYEKLAGIIDEFKKDPKEYGYNLKGVIALRLGLDYRSNNRYFCSQFVAKLLDESGIVKFKKEYHKITPLDFLDELINYPMIYRGKIIYYPSYVNELSRPAKIVQRSS